MNKAVLISIRPEWVEKILSGEKTLEVRKTRPKLDTPFKCYIYCTKGRKPWVRADVPGIRQDGYVVAEFICDNITRLTHVGFSGDYKPPMLAAVRDICRREPIMDFDGGRSCLTLGEIDRYLDGGDGFAWHISNLKVYDFGKSLAWFWSPPELYCEKELCGGCPYDQSPDVYGEYEFDCEGRRPLRRPPQSWCYVEELENA